MRRRCSFFFLRRKKNQKRILYSLELLFVLAMGIFLCGCGAEAEPPPAQEVLAAVETPEPAAEPEPAPEPEPEPVPEPVPEPDPKKEAVERVLAGMSLEEKVGQMFFVRCPDRGAVEKVGQYHLGGYLLFTRDFKDSAGGWLTEQAFTDQIAGYQAASRIPLLIGVDEEGGTVARASRNPNLFPEKCKSPQKLFAEGAWEAIEQDAVDKNSGLLSYGINVNFAPVADVSTDPADFMYDRAFGQDAQATADYVQTVVEAAGNVSFSEGEACYKIGSVLKHFPGYGNNVDTHTGIAVDERPYEQFLAEDFLPFQAGIEAGAGSVLVSHNIIQSMDGELPASLSPEVHRILREELGFEGVILTDDLAMDAVESYAQDGSVAVLAALAGNDMIVTTDFEVQIPLVIDAVRTGILPEETVDNAVRRTLAWKYDLGLLE